MDTEQKNIAKIREITQTQAWRGRLLAQIESLVRKDSSAGKPFWEAKFRDASDNLLLRAWSDSPAFASCESLKPGDPVAVEGEFYLNAPYGIDSRRWTVSPLSEEEANAFFQGDEDSRLAIEKDFSSIEEFVASLADPRLKLLAERFLQQHGERFRRTAAARSFHHARRGGLCAHTAQMMRSANAICQAYPHLNRDLLLTGTLFHDCGKLWETCPPERGFDVPFFTSGELLGHITIGIEIINKIWSSLAQEMENWKTLSPDSERVRLHLLHLIASHHGELQFGSPVEPKTPEATALHYIDNLDAKLEMFHDGYKSAAFVSPEITERIRPLNHRILTPLSKFTPPPEPSHE